ncbi:OsmC family protein [Phenylobacterium sp. LjRoot225]|uniref:OsmC family protein n=1 Tax=Phenylobacterium sp. LjRoot225 TaxID=3342285 RepID=UPI003ECD9528
MSSQDERVAEGVEVRETGGGKFQVEVRAGGVTFLADEPAAVGGLGSGPTPYDLIASALGACTAMTVRLYATRKQWPLDAVTVRVLHRRDGLEAKDRLAREIVLDGDLTPDQRLRILEIANRCPVHQTLTRGVDVITVLAEQPLPGRLDPEPTDHANDMIEACQD